MWCGIVSDFSGRPVQSPVVKFVLKASSCNAHHPIYRLLAFKLPRSHSSPSPPSSKQASGRSDNNRKHGQRFRKRQGSGIVDAQEKSAILDWSTSYHAGSSRLVRPRVHLNSSWPCPVHVSSGSRCSTDDETDDDLPSDSRGRVYSQVQNGNGGPNNRSSPPTLRRLSPHGTSSADSTGSNRNGVRKSRTSFTRSRSPNATRASLNLKPSSKPHRHLSPSVPRNVRQTQEPRTLLNAECRLQLKFPLGLSYYNFSMDNRKLGESLLLLLSLLYSASHIRSYTALDVPFVANPSASVWRSYGNYYFFKNLTQLDL